MSAPVRRVRLGNLPMIQRIVDARDAQLRLLQALDEVVTPPSVLGYRPLVITLDRQVQDSAMLALVRPVIEREVKARIAELDRDLVDLGVDISKDG